MGCVAGRLSSLQMLHKRGSSEGHVTLLDSELASMSTA